MTAPDAEARAVETLVGYVLSWTGYRPSPGHVEAVRRAVRKLRLRGDAVTDLLHRAAQGDLELMGSLIEAVSVPETYFFRQPEHFDWIARTGMARLAGRPVVRAWSAGCATGEEAYSLASCLLASFPAHEGVRVEVVGTDLLARNIDVACTGVYGPWSTRGKGPMPFPTCEALGDGRMTVRREVREVTRFCVHDLRDPPPGTFEIVLCRNVLMYAATDASEAMCANVMTALAPDGIALFGTLDLPVVPAGLVALARPEMNVFALGARSPNRPRSIRPPRPSGGPPARAPSVLPKRRSTPPPRRRDVDGVADGVSLHLSALESIDRGDWARVERDLDRLRRQAPDYVPGLFEYALSLARTGERRLAVPLMQEVLSRLDAHPGDALLAGPEHLPVDYYRVAARAFLASIEVESLEVRAEGAS